MQIGSNEHDIHVGIARGGPDTCIVNGWNGQSFGAEKKLTEYLCTSMLFTIQFNCYLISFTNCTTPWLLPGGKSKVTALQENCFENEATNEADGKSDDDLLVVMQIKMRMSNEIVSRTFILS